MKTYRSIPILFEDNHIIAVCKPSGLLTQRDTSNTESLYDIIKEYIKVTYNKPGNVFLGIVHRLDKRVSGVMMFAKTSKAASRLSAHIRNRSVVKMYCAAVHAVTSCHGGDWHTLHDLVVRAGSKTLIADGPDIGKHASLRYKILHYSQPYSLALIELYTGKKHQIRAQLAHYDVPIANDVKYGGTPIAHYQDIALHACFLQFCHPVSGQTMSCYAAPRGITADLFGHIDVDALIQKALRDEGFSALQITAPAHHV